ncbi:DUF177 domain-containing protein [Magnetospirillum sp. SS-4]|uniref:YceD family protein n=1 Tax=Magnetospirillum sp. SS-4 TaxID=2681465 RepID=UPI001385FCA1|nr:DUF177 domain-containing protein [Magnetospirillum sp. SS-4]CAA7621715.1 conserved hypothetical protein [Magnetospirillum sp. SS-4]
MIVASPEQPEFSRPVQVSQLPARVSRQAIAAEPAERHALVGRLGLIELKSLSASLSLELLGGGLVRVNGQLTAKVVQACVVTLAPLEAVVEDEFEVTFGPPDVELDTGNEIELSWESEDPPDPIVDGCIDLGEVVVEHLALALDPFPRAPGAVFEPPKEQDDVPDGKPNPFAALAALRRKKE